MISSGVHVPGSSVLHRLPAGVKLVALLLGGASTVVLDRPEQVGIGLLVVLGLYSTARLPMRTLVRQLRPVVWLLLLVGAFHVAANGWRRASVVTGLIVLLVLLAGLVTLTTPTTALLDAVVRVLRPLRRLGVDSERVALLLALGIRAVPVVVALTEEVRDAQRARGLTASPRAFAVPLVIRALRHADELGEALAARGVDD